MWTEKKNCRERERQKIELAQQTWAIKTKVPQILFHDLKRCLPINPRRPYSLLPHLLYLLYAQSDRNVYNKVRIVVFANNPILFSYLFSGNWNTYKCCDIFYLPCKGKQERVILVLFLALLTRYELRWLTVNLLFIFSI